MRQRIMMAAVTEMSARGVKFTMNDLARNLGVSKRSIYEHFPSKKELISSIVDTFFDDIRKQRTTILADTTLSFHDKLKKVLCVYPAIFAPFSEHVALQIKHFLPNEWERIEQNIAQEWKFINAFLTTGIETGQIRPIFLPIFQKIFKGFTNEVIDYQFLHAHQLSLTQAKDSLLDILIYGLLPRESPPPVHHHPIDG